MGWGRRAPARMFGRGTPEVVGMSCQGGCAERLRRTRSEAAGAASGAFSDERITVDTRAVLALALWFRLQRAWWGWVHRPRIGPGRGGAAVVLRAGESPRGWGRAAAGLRKEGDCNAERRLTEW